MSKRVHDVGGVWMPFLVRFGKRFGGPRAAKERPGAAQERPKVANEQQKVAKMSLLLSFERPFRTNIFQEHKTKNAYQNVLI